MTRLFGEQARDAALSGERLSVISLWVRCVFDIVVTAPGHHLAKEALVPQPIQAQSTGPVPSIRRGSARGILTVLALLPAWIVLFVSVVAPRGFGPMVENPPGIGGMPAGVVLGGFAVLLTTLGVLVVRRATSPLVLSLSFALLTIPAVVIVILGPAIILLVQNLG